MSDYRSLTRDFLKGMIRAPDTELRGLLSDHLTPDSVWNISHPTNRLEGIDEVLEGFILPLRRALSHIHRRDEIFIGGSNRRSSGGNWVACVTHYVGNFKAPLGRIRPSNSLVFLRAGEFYRIEGGLIKEAKIIVDLLDLLQQVNRFPLPHMLGTKRLFPGPATHDGILPAHRERGGATLDLVERMLENLTDFDPNTFESKGQTGEHGYWHDDMLWFGPGAIGASYRWEGFEKDHRSAFLTAFPDRVGGDHYACGIGDGDYAAVSGWPSMSMTHLGEYLGVKPTNKPLSLRVMDFYRCSEGKIAENWVLLDYLDFFQQMGVNLIGRAESLD